MTRSERSLFLAGGGTGGHLIPGLILAEELDTLGITPVLVTGRRPVEERILDGEPWKRITVNLDGSLPKAVLGILWNIPRMLFKLKKERAIGVLVLGGRIGISVSIAATLLRLPIFLLEINGVPGKTTRILAPLAKRIFLALPQNLGHFSPKKVVVSGIPLSSPFLSPPSRETAKDALGLAKDSGPVLMVFGGSMGAKSVNRAVLDTLARPKALPRGTTVIHITGPSMEVEAREAWATSGVTAKVFPFLKGMVIAYAAADLVICRGGAMTIAEVAGSGRAAIVIPYPWHKDNHQRVNAQSLVSAGAARTLSQESLDENLAPLVCELLGRPKEVAKMGRIACKTLPPKGPRVVLDQVLSTLV